MSERTNEEKLRILQDRLATIQNKNEIEQQIKTEKNKQSKYKTLPKKYMKK